MNCSSMENVLGKMNRPHGATFEAFGAKTGAEKKAVRLVVYSMFTTGCATWEIGGRYRLTDKGQHKLDEIMDAKKVAS